jgi:hypothetical protein
MRPKYKIAPLNLPHPEQVHREDSNSKSDARFETLSSCTWPVLRKPGGDECAWIRGADQETTRKRDEAYFRISLSMVTSDKFSEIAWAISARSKGSW